MIGLACGRRREKKKINWSIKRNPLLTTEALPVLFKVPPVGPAAKAATIQRRLERAKQAVANLVGNPTSRGPRNPRFVRLLVLQIRWSY
jgi:hypothetical protein